MQSSNRIKTLSIKTCWKNYRIKCCTCFMTLKLSIIYLQTTVLILIKWSPESKKLSNFLKAQWFYKKNSKSFIDFFNISLSVLIVSKMDHWFKSYDHLTLAQIEVILKNVIYSRYMKLPYLWDLTIKFLRCEKSLREMFTPMEGKENM